MKKARLLMSIGILLSILSASGAIAAPNSPDSPDELGTLTQIGALESSSIQDIVVQGNYAYTGFASTLVVIDISDPANMTRLASLRLGSVIVAMHATQDFLYISSQAGLWIIDISNPLSPVKTGFYPTYGYSAIAVQGGFAYIDTYRGLEIIDISTPDNPLLAGMLKDIGGLSDIAISENYMYLSGDFYEIYPGVKGIMVFDISDPVQPDYAGLYTPESPSDISQIEISGSRLYIGSNVFQVLDISIPAAPTLTGSVYFFGWSPGLALSGDTVYLALESCPYECLGGFNVIDVSDPASPILVGEYSSTNLSEIKSISAVDGHVFLTRPGEVQSIAATVPPSPTLVDTLESPLDYPRRFAVSGDYAYLTNLSDTETSSLRIADISDPSQPVIVGQFPTTGELTDVEIDGDMVILTEADNTYFIDVSNHQSPVEIGRFQSTGGRFVGVDVQAGYAYLALELGLQENGGRVLVLDIGDPTQPHQVGYYEPPASEPFRGFTDVVVQGSYAYLPAPEGLLILDISNPQDPVKAGEYGREQYQLRMLYDVALLDDYLYLVGMWEISILDNRNPSQPIEISRYDVGAQDSRIAVQENQVFVSGQEGLIALDVSTITTPTLAAFYSSPGGHDVSVIEDDIFFTSGEGFQILRMTGSISGVVRSPNRSLVPGVSITANGTQAAITDSQGTYFLDNLEPGSYTIVPSLEGFTFTPTQSQLVVPPNQIANFTLLPMPVSVELTPGITTTLSYTDFQGLPTSFIFPPELVSSPATAFVTPTLATEAFGSAFTGHAFELELLAGGEPVFSTTFPVPVSIAIQYSPLDTAVISDTLMLALYRQNGAAWVKTEDTCSATPTPVPIEPGIFRTTVCQSGRYALFGPTYAIALPQVSYGSNTSEVSLP